MKKNRNKHQESKKPPSTKISEFFKTPSSNDNTSEPTSSVIIEKPSIISDELKELHDQKLETAFDTLSTELVYTYSSDAMKDSFRRFWIEIDNIAMTLIPNPAEHQRLIAKAEHELNTSDRFWVAHAKERLGVTEFTYKQEFTNTTEDDLEEAFSETFNQLLSDAYSLLIECINVASSEQDFVDAINGWNSTIQQITEDFSEHASIIKQEADIFFKEREEETKHYLNERRAEIETLENSHPEETPETPEEVEFDDNTPSVSTNLNLSSRDSLFSLICADLKQDITNAKTQEHLEKAIQQFHTCISNHSQNLSFNKDGEAQIKILEKQAEAYFNRQAIQELIIKKRKQLTAAE